MRKALKIRNEFFKLGENYKTGERVNIVITTITYEDGVVSSYSTINPLYEVKDKTTGKTKTKVRTVWKDALKEQISNYEDFSKNMETWKNDGVYVEEKHETPYLDPDDIEEEDTIKYVRQIDVERIKEKDRDIALIEITRWGKDVSIACDYADLDDVLEEMVPNLEKLKKKEKVTIYQDEEEYSDDFIQDIHEYDDKVQIFVGRVEKEDNAMIYFTDSETGLYSMMPATLSEAYKHVESKKKNGEDIIVEYRDNESKEILSENEVKEIVKKRNAEALRKEEIGNQIISNLKKDGIIENKTNNVTTATKEKVKTNNTSKKIEVSRIVGYYFKDENGDLRHQAILFYSDGTVKNVDMDTALDSYRDHIKEKTNNSEMIPQDYFTIVSGEELTKNWGRYIKEATNQTAKEETRIVVYKPPVTKDKDKDKDNDDDKVTPVVKKNSSKTTKSKVKKEGFFKRHAKAAIALITAGALAIAGVAYAIFGKHKIKDRDINPSKSQTQDIDNNKKTPVVKKDYTNTKDILLELSMTNTERYNFLVNVGSTLKQYNIDVADRYYENGKGTKLAHSYQELMMQYLLYNDIADSDIHKIFGNQYLDEASLKAAFKNGIIQDGYAHNLQNINLEKTLLFKSEEACDFYAKYNFLFTGMNQVDDVNIKANNMHEFCEMVRTDFPGMKNNDYSNVKPYQLSILEYYQASKNMKVVPDNWFTKDEIKYLDGLYSQVADKRIADIVTKQNARALIEEKETTPQASEYFDLLVKELEDNNSYNVSKDQTNVTNYDSYKLHTEGIGQITKEETNTNNTNTNTNTNNDANNYTNTNNNNNTTYVEYPTEEEPEEYTFYVNGSEEDDADYTFEIDLSEEPTSTPEVTPEEEQKDEEVSLDDLLSEEAEYEPAKEESNVTYYATVTDENGNLLNYYSNVTTDGTNAYQPGDSLPNPNEFNIPTQDELSLDSIIGSSYTEESYETAKQLVLKR